MRETIQIPIKGNHICPSDVMMDHFLMLRGVIQTIGGCINKDYQPLDPEDLAWAFIVMSELLRHLEEDIQFLDEHYQKAEKVEKVEAVAKVKKKSPKPLPKSTTKKSKKKNLVAA